MENDDLNEQVGLEDASIIQVEVVDASAVVFILLKRGGAAQDGEVAALYLERGG